MNKILLPTLLALSIALHAGAQEAATTSAANTKTTKNDVRQSIQMLKQGTRSDINQLREGLREEVRSAKQTSQTQVRTASSTRELLKGLQQKREEFRKEIEAKRNEAQGKIKTLRADLHVRLQKIKDEKKRATVEKIAEQIDALNKRMLDQYSAILEKMESSLERIGSRADKAEARGLNVSVVRSAVAEAQKTIEASRAAITEQAGKTYTVEVSTEGKLGLDVGKTRQALHADLTKVRDMVKAAHDAVRNAAVILAQIPRIDEDKPENATATPASTSTAPTPTP